MTAARQNPAEALIARFAYNGDGVRVGKTVGGATTDYLVDLAATLPVVISDTDAVYLYGLDIIAEQLALRQGSGQAQRYYYVHDGLGSVRHLLDNTGQIAETYAYDPFGVALSGGSVPNPYRFTGEAWDAEMELLYLRARYYQPRTGRFVTKDPWKGDVWRPGTLDLYVYVQNNAVNYADPSGLQGPYDPDESFRQAMALVREWFFEEGGERKSEQRFGPNEPLTMDVRHSRGVQAFQDAWAEEGYQVPWNWEYRIDLREGYLLPMRLVWGAAAYASAQWDLFQCRIGRGSQTPEGQVDAVAGVIGSFHIYVYQETHDLLKFEVRNVMGWASASRVYGTNFSFLEDVERSESWRWGGTIRQYFYWVEPAANYPHLRRAPIFAPKRRAHAHGRQ